MGAVVSIGILIALVFGFRVCGDSGPHSSGNPDYPAKYDLQTFEDQGRDHVAAGTVVDTYNSNPPTSGPHGPLVQILPGQNWGVSPVPAAKESAVHNMEHGGVVVWYNCDGGPAPLEADSCEILEDQLSEIVLARVNAGMFILMTPYEEMENRIALTAWRNLDTFDEFDGVRIEAFIASFECRFDPEGFC